MAVQQEQVDITVQCYNLISFLQEVDFKHAVEQRNVIAFKIRACSKMRIKSAPSRKLTIFHQDVLMFSGYK